MLHSHGQKLAHSARTRVQHQGLIPDRILLARVLDGPFDNDSILGQRDFNDGRAGLVHGCPGALLLHHQVHVVVVECGQGSGQHLPHREEGGVQVLELEAGLPAHPLGLVLVDDPAQVRVLLNFLVEKNLS